MVRVSIDVEAGNAFFEETSALLDRVIEEWSDVATAARNGLTSTKPVRGLETACGELVALRDDLRTRVDLAVLYNTNASHPVAGGEPVVMELSDDSTAGVKAQLGVELADAFTEADMGNPSRETVERIDAAAILLSRYADDEAVTNAMVDHLGPEGVLELPLQLRNLHQNFELYPPGADEDRFWDAETLMTEHLSEVEQRFLEAFGTAVATTTRSDAFATTHPDFAREIAEAACESPNGMGWGLSQVLRYGDYDSAFLVTVGEELYAFEQDQVGPVWGTQFDGRVQSWHLGTADDTGQFDPFVGLFGAMGRNPEAALDFLNPDSGGPIATDRAEYFIEDRRWSHDDFNALGLALDAAATRFHTSSAPVELQERSAWVASATIHFLAERDGGMHDRRIGDAGKDSLAHLLSAYIIDVDRVANGYDAESPPGTSDLSAIAPWEIDGLIGAEFGLADLNDVMGEVLTSDRAMGQLAEAAARYNAYRMDAAVDAWNADPSAKASVDASVQTSAKLQGYLIGNLERASKAAGKSVDERNGAFLDLAGSVVDLVPTGGTFVSFLADQAKDAGKDALTGALTGNEDAAAASAFKAQQQTIEDLQTAMAVSLTASPRIDDVTTIYKDGTRLPWFGADGSFLPSALDDPAVLAEFRRWTGVGGGGEVITENIPDLTESFDVGQRLGRGSN